MSDQKNYAIEDLVLWLAFTGQISELQAQVMLASAVTETNQLPEIK